MTTPSIRLPHRVTVYAICLLFGLAGWAVMLGELVMLQTAPTEGIIALVVSLSSVGLGGLLRWIATHPQQALMPLE